MIDDRDIKPVLAAIKYLSDRKPKLYRYTQKGGIVKLYQIYYGHEGRTEWHETLKVDLYTKDIFGRLY